MTEEQLEHKCRDCGAPIEFCECDGYMPLPPEE